MLLIGTTETEYVTFDCEEILGFGKRVKGKGILASMIDDDNDLMNMVIELLIHDGVGDLIQM